MNQFLICSMLMELGRHGLQFSDRANLHETKEYTYVCSRMTILNIKCTKEANSDFLIPISVQPDVRDLQYFKLKIMLDKLI